MGLGNQQEQKSLQQSSSPAEGKVNASTGTGTRSGSNDVQDQLLKSQEEQKALEEQLKKLKDDIAKSKMEAQKLQKLACDSKEKKNGDDDNDNGDVVDDDNNSGSKRKAEE